MRGLLVRSQVVGFGVGVAGAATARGLPAMTPRAVVQIGTCGVYPHQAEYRPYDVIVPFKILALDHSVLRGHAGFAPVALRCQRMVKCARSEAATGRERLLRHR